MEITETARVKASLKRFSVDELVELFPNALPGPRPDAKPDAIQAITTKLFVLLINIDICLFGTDSFQFKGMSFEEVSRLELDLLARRELSSKLNETRVPPKKKESTKKGSQNDDISAPKRSWVGFSLRYDLLGTFRHCHRCFSAFHPSFQRVSALKYQKTPKSCNLSSLPSLRRISTRYFALKSFGEISMTFPLEIVRSPVRERPRLVSDRDI